MPADTPRDTARDAVLATFDAIQAWWDANGHALPAGRFFAAEDNGVVMFIADGEAGSALATLIEAETFIEKVKRPETTP